MAQQVPHGAMVDQWLERSAQGRSPEALVRLLEAASNALWDRAEVTLGEITLTAIADRVLTNLVEHYPPFSLLQIEPDSGFDCTALREGVAGFGPDELKAGLRFLLVNLLTVIGNLTAELLSEELHAALSQVGLPGAAATPTPPGPEGEQS